MLATLILKYECTVTRHLKKARKRDKNRTKDIREAKQARYEKNFFTYNIHRAVVLMFGCMLESTGDIYIYIYFNIYLAAPGLSCGMWDL